MSEEVVCSKNLYQESWTQRNLDMARHDDITKFQIN